MKIILFSEVTLDGKMTIANGSSKDMLTILCKEEVTIIQESRRIYDAILVGRKTITKDNPFLTYKEKKEYSPTRVIMSNRLNFTFQENIFTDEYKTIVVTSSTNYEKINQIKNHGKEVLILEKSEIENMKYVTEKLEENYSIHSLLVEGGGEINWKFLEEDLFDELHLLQIPILVGGVKNTTLVDGEGFFSLEGSKRYKVKQIRQIGDLVYTIFLNERRMSL